MGITKLMQPTQKAARLISVVEWHAKTDWHKSHIDNKEIIGADLYEIKRQSRNRHWR